MLVGERGHYALSAGADALPYIEAMTKMTGDGGLLPEQIWDSDQIPGKGLFPGKPSGSAMPLVWAHGEFIKLCHSFVQGRPVDRPTATWNRYQGKRPQPGYRLWGLRQRPRLLPAGQELRVLLDAPFTLHWGTDGWQHIRDTASEDWGLGHIAIIPVQLLKAVASIQFTVHWRDDDRWQGEDFHMDIAGDAS